MKSYICPHCRERQTSIRQWQNVSAEYEYDLETQQWEMTDNFEGGEHESWNCPDCGGCLDDKIDIDKIL